MTDNTFTSIARRAAQYPLIWRKSQMLVPEVRKQFIAPAASTESLGWLLLNTLEVNRILTHAPPRKA
jgi:hypothetical protein